MKRILAILLAFTMALTACAPVSKETEAAVISSDVQTEVVSAAESGTKSGVDDDLVAESELDEEENTASMSNFTGLDDPNLLQYVEDSVYADLVDEFASEDYIIENVAATYVSKEYLEELSYNSQSNIFFGYTLAELDAQFQGTRYVFTLDDNGETVVQAFEAYDDTYERALKNVAIGTGVILVCVTVSTATAGVGLTTVSTVFAASAKSATVAALSSGIMGGTSAGIVKGIQTKDLDTSLKAAALEGSEGFKWAAVSGAILGGATKLRAIRETSRAVDGAVVYEKGAVEIADDVPKWRQAELRALNENGGYEQLSFLDGKQVPKGTPGSTRPDVIQNLGDHIHATEVKYYNLESPACRNTLYRELKREIPNRVINLPPNATQSIVLDVTGREFRDETITMVKNEIWQLLANDYPNIPIEIVGAA